jgi:signal transduction histidine kinase
MDSQQFLNSGREWAVFGLKWLLLILFALALFMTRQGDGLSNPGEGVIFAFAIGAVANFLVALCLLIPFMKRATLPVIALGDLAIAVVFLHLNPGHPVMWVALPAVLMMTGLLVLGPIWGTVQVTALLLAVFGVTSTTLTPVQAFSFFFETSLVETAILVGIAVVGIVSAFVLDRVVGVQQRYITALQEGETQVLNNLRERTRAIYELTTDFNTTLNYQKILDAALDVGRLGLRESASRSFSGAVLLFRPEDGGLHIVAGRRLTRADQRVVSRGTDGIIAEALREAEPIFSEKADDDPELQYFAGFQHARSLMCIPLRAGFDNYGVLIYGSEARGAFDKDMSELLAAVGTQVTIALQNAVLYHNLVGEKMRIVEVEEDARKKLARDLHDGPTQSIAAIAMRMSYIQKLMTRRPEEVMDELGKVEDLARRTTQEIRHMLFTLRPLVLESQGLSAALEQLADKMQDMHGQRVAINVYPGAVEILDGHQQGVLFYVVEEAVNNARKHAQAEVIRVNLSRKTDVVMCKIADNGVGFDTSAVDNNYERRGSLGMVNMRERVALLDGTLQIASEIGKGTTITVLVPIRDPLGESTIGDGAKLTRLAPMSRPNGVPH